MALLDRGEAMFRLNLSIARGRSGESVTSVFREQLSAFDGPDGLIAFVGLVEVEVTVINMEEQYWLSGKVRGRVELSCARCLKHFEYPFQTAFTEKYIQGRDYGDAEVAVVEGDLVDFTDQVVQSVLLALPMKALCHAECRGFCSECGQVLNQADCSCHIDHFDPRFAELAKFIKSDPRGVE